MSLLRATLVACAIALLASPINAQSLSLEELQKLPEGSQRELNDITTETQDSVSPAPGAVIRALDKLSGQVVDLEIAKGETVRFGRIDITLGDCRFPSSNAASEAYTYLVIRNTGQDEAAFQGWMVASSPALNALDHPRYDVWALRCKTS
ncbi:MAG: hypothetical protein ACJA06_001678 [Halocynthiibacter sp.]|jgi:hypothetical protein